MSYQTDATVAEDVTFVRCVRQAVVEAAINISSEDPGTTNHAARRELAAKVLAAPNGWAEVFAVGVATNPNIGTGTSDPVDDDGALGFVVASIWDAYTG